MEKRWGSNDGRYTMKKLSIPLLMLIALLVSCAEVKPGQQTANDVLRESGLQLPSTVELIYHYGSGAKDEPAEWVWHVKGEYRQADVVPKSVDVVEVRDFGALVTMLSNRDVTLKDSPIGSQSLVWRSNNDKLRAEVLVLRDSFYVYLRRLPGNLRQ